MSEEQIVKFRVRWACTTILLVVAMICGTITIYNVLSIGSAMRIKLTEIDSFNPTINPPGSELPFGLPFAPPSAKGNQL